MGPCLGLGVLGFRVRGFIARGFRGSGFRGLGVMVFRVVGILRNLGL